MSQRKRGGRRQDKDYLNVGRERRQAQRGACTLWSHREPSIAPSDAAAG